MAIVLASKRDSFIVVASERKALDIPAGIFEEDPQKIILHRSQPFAFVTTGIASLTDAMAGNQVDVTALLDRALGEFNNPAGFRLEDIAARIANRMHPMVRQKIRQVPANAPESERRVDIVIAYVRGTTAEMGRCRIADRVETGFLNTYVDAPGPILQFLQSDRFKTPTGLFAENLSDPVSVANHMRRVVLEAVAHDASLHGGKNELCGTTVEVAIIGPKLARFVQAA